MPDTDRMIIEALLAEYEGVDVLPRIRAVLAGLAPNADNAQVAAALAQDPGWKYYDEAIEWDMSRVGIAGVAKGLGQLAQWWRLFAGNFNSHMYEKAVCRDLEGGWVISKATVKAIAGSAQKVDGPAVQLWRVQDGKITIMRGYRSEAEALAAPR